MEDTQLKSANWKYILFVFILALIFIAEILNSWQAMVKEMEAVPPASFKVDSYSEMYFSDLAGKSGTISFGDISVKKSETVDRSATFGDKENYYGGIRQQCLEEYEVENIARVEMKGWLNLEPELYYDRPPEKNRCDGIYEFTVYDEDDKIIDNASVKFSSVENPAAVDALKLNNKTYFLVHGGVLGGARSNFFLYAIDENKIITPAENFINRNSLMCAPGYDYKLCETAFLIGYKDNVYLVNGDEARSVNKDNVFKDWIIADALVFKNDKLFFKKDNSSCFKFSYGQDYSYEVRTRYESGKTSFVNAETLRPITANVCVDEYFSKGADYKFRRANSEFKMKYLREARKNDEILKKESWGYVKWEATRAIAPESACVAQGTKILMANGEEKNIEEIKQGDKVASFDFSLSKNTVSEVVENISRKDPLMLINGKLKLSPDHPVYANGEFKEAKDVKIGDSIIDGSGKEMKIDSIVSDYNPQSESGQEYEMKTYDLKLNTYRNFFADDILVGGLYPVIDDWISPLLSRTLNLIYADNSERAIGKFTKDFDSFIVTHPVEGIKKSDSETLRQNLYNTIWNMKK